MIDDGSKIRIEKDTKMLLKLMGSCAGYVLLMGVIIALVIIMGMGVINPIISVTCIAVCVGILFITYSYIKEINNKWEAYKRKVLRDRKDARKAQDDREYRKYILDHNLDSVSKDEASVYIDGKWVSPDEAYKIEVADAVRSLIATIVRYLGFPDIGHINVYNDDAAKAIRAIEAEIVESLADSKKHVETSGYVHVVDDEDENDTSYEDLASITTTASDETAPISIDMSKPVTLEKKSKMHNDHFDAFLTFLEKHGEDVTVRRKNEHNNNMKIVRKNEKTFLNTLKNKKKDIGKACDDNDENDTIQASYNIEAEKFFDSESGKVLHIDYEVDKGRFFDSDTGKEVSFSDIAATIDEAGGVSVIVENDDAMVVDSENKKSKTVKKRGKKGE